MNGSDSRRSLFCSSQLLVCREQTTTDSYETLKLNSLPISSTLKGRESGQRGGGAERRRRRWRENGRKKVEEERAGKGESTRKGFLAVSPIQVAWHKLSWKRMSRFGQDSDGFYDAFQFRFAAVIEICAMSI